MWSAILALFPTVAGWINLIVGWFQARAQAQKDQSSAVDSAVKEHDQDGAQSVKDRDSSDAQNAALDEKLKQIDNPTPVVVVNNGEKPNA